MRSTLNNGTFAFAVSIHLLVNLTWVTQCPLRSLSPVERGVFMTKSDGPGKRVIIIGTGIAGMTAAYLLNRAYDIQVFESADYIGGHTNTMSVQEGNRTIPVDTGFIVCNPLAYPGLMRLFQEVGVETQQSLMSFSVSDRVTGFELGSRSLNNTFAQRRQLINPRFWKFILDFFRFNREAAEAMTDPKYANHTIGQFLQEKRYSGMFVHHFIIPATSAIWSTPYQFTYKYPAQSLFRFYRNHGLVGGQRTKWRTVTGGSQAYVPKVTASYRDRIHVNNGARSVRRTANGVTVSLMDGSQCEADHVVFACHSDQALALLEDPTPQEREILSNVPYLANDVILHTDPRLMPRNRRAWESWNYMLYTKYTGADTSKHAAQDDQPVTLTYWMNCLQSLKKLGAQKDYFVTVNPQELIDPSKVIRKFVYHHPQYDFNTIRAQARLPEINGVKETHFCGAWCRYGFHEDGLQSAVTVAANLGIQW